MFKKSPKSKNRRGDTEYVNIDEKNVNKNSKETTGTAKKAFCILSAVEWKFRKRKRMHAN